MLGLQWTGWGHFKSSESGKYWFFSDRWIAVGKISESDLGNALQWLRGRAVCCDVIIDIFLPEEAVR
jgi:hypothetical protein